MMRRAPMFGILLASCALLDAEVNVTGEEVHSQPLAASHLHLRHLGLVHHPPPGNAALSRIESSPRFEYLYDGRGNDITTVTVTSNQQTDYNTGGEFFSFRSFDNGRLIIFEDAGPGCILHWSFLNATKKTEGQGIFLCSCRWCGSSSRRHGRVH